MLALFAGPGPSLGDETAAARTIDKLNGVLIEMLKEGDALGFDGRRERLAPVVSDAFDLGFMALKSLGPHARKLDAAARALWVETFGAFVVANFARQFDGGYDGHAFENDGVVEAPHDTLIVKTTLVRPRDDDVELHYRLREVKGDSGPVWRVIDVYSDGTVSELALRRSEFSSLFRRDGFEALVSTVRDKSERE